MKRTLEDTSYFNQQLRVKDYNRHKDRITHIIYNRPHQHGIREATPGPVINKLKTRQQNFSIDVFKTNEVLLERLVQISNNPGEYAPKDLTRDQLYAQSLVRAKHSVARQKQQEQIQKENIHMAQRILQQSQFKGKNQMKRDIQDYLSIKDRLQKFRQQNKYSFVKQVKQLPPVIQYSPQKIKKKKKKGTKIERSSSVNEPIKTNTSSSAGGRKRFEISVKNNQYEESTPQQKMAKTSYSSPNYKNSKKQNNAILHNIYFNHKQDLGNSQIKIARSRINNNTVNESSNLTNNLDTTLTNNSDASNPKANTQRQKTQNNNFVQNSNESGKATIFQKTNTNTNIQNSLKSASAKKGSIGSVDDEELELMEKVLKQQQKEEQKVKQERKKSKSIEKKDKPTKKLTTIKESQERDEQGTKKSFYTSNNNASNSSKKQQSDTANSTFYQQQTKSKENIKNS